MIKADEYWMTCAINMAMSHPFLSDINLPFGCVIINYNNVIIAAANGTGNHHDPTAHCEMFAIQQACKVVWHQHVTSYLRGCTIYSTAEPCPMCTSAINHAKISRVVWGSWRTDLPHLFRPTNVSIEKRLRDTSHPPDMLGGVLRQKCIALFDGIKKWDTT